MAIVTATLPTIGDPNTTEDVDVRNVLAALLNEVNGLLDAANIEDGSLGNAEMAANAAIAYSKLNLAGSLTKDDLATALATALGVSSTATVRRGKSIIATEQARTNAAYGPMATPDEVLDVVLPTDGLMLVTFTGTWKSSVSAAGRAAIFLNGVQLQRPVAIDGTNVVDETSSNTTVNRYVPLTTTHNGLASLSASGAAADYAGWPTTGVLVNYGAGAGGFFVIEAAAGTYDVDVRYKSASGSVTVKDRKLKVFTMGF